MLGGREAPSISDPFYNTHILRRLLLKHGSYECNPPFVTPIMDAAAAHIHNLLEAAESAGGALSFCVVVPGWQETAAWRQLSASRFLRARVLIAAAEHGAFRRRLSVSLAAATAGSPFGLQLPVEGLTPSSRLRTPADIPPPRPSPRVLRRCVAPAAGPLQGEPLRLCSVCAAKRQGGGQVEAAARF